MKILVLCYEFPPVGGGGGKVAEDLSALFVQRGHEVSILTSHCSDLPIFEVRSGVKVQRVRCFRSKYDGCSIFEMALYIIFSIIPAIRLARSFKPNLMHVHFAVPTGVVAYLVRLVTGVPYVLTAHLGDVPGGVPEQTDKLFKWLNWMIKFIWKTATKVTAVSHFVANLCQKHYSVPVEYIPNGVNLKNIENISRSTHFNNVAESDSVLRFVFVGRFNSQKNLLFLIKVLAKMRDLQWRLELVGDGPERNKIVHCIQEFQLLDRVKLHGWVETSQAEAIMAKNDVLVLPSLSEGFPVVAVKALGMGLAIVGSDIGGLQDLISDNVNGFFFKLNDSFSAEQVLRHIISLGDGMSSLKKESLQKAKHFDIEKIVTQYEKVFELC